MNEKIIKLLFWLRDGFWNIRKFLRKDAFETDRTNWRCGLLSMDYYRTKKEIEKGLYPTFRELVDRLECYIRTCDGGRGIIPEINCAMQYEEDGQLFSAHWYLDEKYQLHVRFFDFRGHSAKARECQEVEVRAHVEIRPDYDAIAHLRGKEMVDGCSEFWKFYGMVD